MLWISEAISGPSMALSETTPQSGVFLHRHRSTRRGTTSLPRALSSSWFHQRTLFVLEKNPSIVIQAPSSWDAGPDAYFAQVEVFHQIHCLNELRKEVFRDYYYDQAEADERRLSHKMHCIHMLLQVLMCSADVGIITHNWVHSEKLQEPKTRPFPDFNVVKKCRDFDAILDWVRETGVKDVHGKFPKLRHPAGVPIVPGDGYA
jgi:hypothetical protein